MPRFGRRFSRYYYSAADHYRPCLTCRVPLWQHRGSRFVCPLVGRIRKYQPDRSAYADCVTAFADFLEETAQFAEQGDSMRREHLMKTLDWKMRPALVKFWNEAEDAGRAAREDAECGPD